MQFLLSAKRMNRGMARIRQIIILSLRVLAVLGLIVALSRPLASGWVGVTMGGSADTSIILLDRSASMEQRDPRTGMSKRETALQKVAGLLEKRGSAGRIVLIDSAGLSPQELESPSSLLELPSTQATATTADIAAMVQRSLDYLKDNISGRTDIWLLSDLRVSDWTPESGRWEGIREAAQEMDALRLYILAYPENTGENLAVSATPVVRQAGTERDTLVLDINLRNPSGGKPQAPVPVGITVNGARTVIDVDMDQSEVVLQGHGIPVDKKTRQGWGRIDLPNDANPQDNSAYFVFGEAPPRKTVIVTDDSSLAAPLKAATSAPVDSGFDYEAEVFSPGNSEEIPWDSAALILWHGDLPTGVAKAHLESFVESGRVVMFFPPANPADREIFGVSWGDWQMHPDPDAAELAWWRPDSDLLQNSLSGKALPVGSLKLNRYAPLSGRFTPLARVEEQRAVLGRAITDTGAAYFCGMLPQSSHSNLAREGVVFYVMLQRALAAGTDSLSNARQVEAGTFDPSVGEWKRLAPNQEGLISQQFLHAGAFQKENRLMALNRPLEEDEPAKLDQASIEALLGEMNFEFIQDQAGTSTALAHEVWRVLLILMALALIAEAILCLPPTRNTANLTRERQTS